MAPRGRPRKVGTARIDAAFDAMGQMGFPKNEVKSMMNKLLMEYGGVEGYPFIEENSFLVLINALTEQDEKKYWEAQSVEVEASTKQGESHDTAGPAGENAGSSISHSSDTPLLQTDLAPAPDGYRGGEDNLDGLSLLATCALESQSPSTRRRSRPGNGSIRADDWVSLPPAVNEVPTPLPAAVQLRRSKRIKNL